jgi:hypothetical protein
MHRRALTLLVLACACGKTKEASPEFQAVAVTAPSPAAVASPAPSASASAVASAAPSATELGQFGEPFGAGELGLTVPDGGGYAGGTVGLGNIGTLGHGAGTGTGSGYGAGHGAIGHGRAARILQGLPMVSGRLPPEVVTRIVRRSFGSFRVCYEQGLARDPRLAGKVVTKLVIDEKGAVAKAARDAATTLGDAAVVSCIVGTFSRMTFPQPEGGIVTVVVPLVLRPPPP